MAEKVMAGETDRSVVAERPAPEVVVVGAGVSGCACAAALASEGLRVTLVNSAMDRVGLPAYGPDVLFARGESPEEALKSVPRPLLDVWLQAAKMPVEDRKDPGGERMSDPGVLNIDRRRVSIETKRIMEKLPGLHFRQGFVTDLRLVDDARRVEVETIFGEVFRADAVVVAVGLSLRARANVGRTWMTGGRYGEPASDDLYAALERLGAVFDETVLEVGPRVSVRSAEECGWLGRPADVTDEGQERGDRGPIRRLLAVQPEVGAQIWPAHYPPAPHLSVVLNTGQMLGVTHGSEDRRGASWGLAPLLSPDGAVTQEMYVAPQSRFAQEMLTADTRSPAENGEPVGEGTPRATVERVGAGIERNEQRVVGEVGDLAAKKHGYSSAEQTGCLTDESQLQTPRLNSEPIATRVAHKVVAATVVGLDDQGRMVGQQRREAMPVWVVGRAAGAGDYVESLLSGLRSASDVVVSLRSSRPTMDQSRKTGHVSAKADQ